MDVNRYVVNEFHSTGADLSAPLLRDGEYTLADGTTVSLPRAVPYHINHKKYYDTTDTYKRSVQVAIQASSAASDFPKMYMRSYYFTGGVGAWTSWILMNTLVQAQLNLNGTENILLQLGSELLSTWTTGTGWSGAGPYAHAGASGTLSQNLAGMSSGEIYLLKFEITTAGTAGSTFTIQLGGGTFITISNIETGIYQMEIVCGGTASSPLVITSASSISIGNISLKRQYVYWTPALKLNPVDTALSSTRIKTITVPISGNVPNNTGRIITASASGIPFQSGEALYYDSSLSYGDYRDFYVADNSAALYLSGNYVLIAEKDVSYGIKFYGERYIRDRINQAQQIFSSFGQLLLKPSLPVYIDLAQLSGTNLTDKNGQVLGIVNNAGNTTISSQIISAPPLSVAALRNVLYVNGGGSSAAGILFGQELINICRFGGVVFSVGLFVYITVANGTVQYFLDLETWLGIMSGR